MDHNNKSNEYLKKIIIDLEIRIKRIEEFLLDMPNARGYIEVPTYTDDLLDEAVKLVQQYNTVSAAFLQRKMGIGYARAYRLLDLLEKKGIISPAQGAKPRKVLLKNDSQE